MKKNIILLAPVLFFLASTNITLAMNMKKIKTEYYTPTQKQNEEKITTTAQAKEVLQDETKKITLLTVVSWPINNTLYSISQVEKIEGNNSLVQFLKKNIKITVFEEEKTEHKSKEVVETLKEKIREFIRTRKK